MGALFVGMVLVGIGLGVKWYVDKKKTPPPFIAPAPAGEPDVQVAPDAFGGAPDMNADAKDDPAKVPRPSKREEPTFVAPFATLASASVDDQRLLESHKRAEVEAAGAVAGVLPVEKPVTATEIARSPDVVEAQPYEPDKKPGLFAPDDTIVSLPSLRTIETGAVENYDAGIGDPDVGPAALANGTLTLPEGEPVYELVPAMEDPAATEQLGFE